MPSSLFSNFTFLICILRACGDLSCDHNVARFGAAPPSSHLDFAFGLRSQGLVIAEGNLHGSARARSNRCLYVVTALNVAAVNLKNSVSRAEINLCCWRARSHRSDLEPILACVTRNAKQCRFACRPCLNWHVRCLISPSRTGLAPVSENVDNTNRCAKIALRERRSCRAKNVVVGKSIIT